MDTLTHALSGALLARLVCVRATAAASLPAPPQAPGRWSAAWDGAPGALPPWQAVAVTALAAAFPDSDALVMLAGDTAYLRHHRGVTHSLLMAPLWALLLAALLRWAFADLRVRPGGWKPLVPLALAGVVLHIAGDWITPFGTMMLAPASDARFGLGAMFIIDLTFSGLLVAGLLLAAAFPRRRWPAALGLLASAAWVGLAWSAKREAEDVGRQYARAQGIAVQFIDAAPRPASPYNWSVAVFDGQRYHLAHLNLRRTEALTAGADASFIRRLSAPYLPVAQARWQTVPRFGGPDAPPWVRAAWEHDALAVFRWFAVTPALAAAQERPGPDGAPERCAVFRDLRFEFPGRAESPFRYGVCLRGADGREGRRVRLEGDRLLPAS